MTSRIIPTRVGTRKYTMISCALLQDHPHACGDKKNVQADILNGIGSSPRVWGQGVSAHLTLSMRGIIPTRVGTRDYA